MKAIRGPQEPTTIDQKIAGFSREAHLRYINGLLKNWTGAMVPGCAGLGREGECRLEVNPQSVNGDCARKVGSPGGGGKVVRRLMCFRLEMMTTRLSRLRRRHRRR